MQYHCQRLSGNLSLMPQGVSCSSTYHIFSVIHLPSFFQFFSTGSCASSDVQSQTSFAAQKEAL